MEIVIVLRLMVLGIVFTIVGICWGQEPSLVGGEVARHAIEDVLRNAQVSGSLAYWGYCDLLQPLPEFPNVHRLPKSWAGSPLQALRAMFADDPKMHITQDSSGKIRMIESDVPRDLLEVRISHISFKDYDGRDGVWVPRQARRIIAAAPEVRDFMRSQKIGWARDVEYMNDISGGPSPDLPHVSGDLYNVTVEEALDYVSQSFPGLWVYENCRSESGSRVLLLEIYWISALTPSNN